jgi:hypothetical protein
MDTQEAQTPSLPPPGHGRLSEVTLASFENAGTPTNVPSPQT